MKAVLPIGGLLIGVGIGAGVGLELAPKPATGDNEYIKDDDRAETTGKNKKKKEPGAAYELVSLHNQFVVPLVDNGRVAAMVVVSIGLEVEVGETEAIYAREPRLRDTFLQVLFEHANMGGFSGDFTNARNLNLLRKSLTRSAQGELGSIVKNILITDLARQDI